MKMITTDPLQLANSIHTFDLRLSLPWPSGAHWSKIFTFV